MDDELVTDLSPDECWQLLRTHQVARLAYHLGPDINLVPINYVVDGATLLFRTAPGNKLLGLLMNPAVILEIDEYDEQHARSVVVRGAAERLEEDQQHRVDDLPLHPWAEDEKYEVIEITPTQITGRAFQLTRSNHPVG